MLKLRFDYRDLFNAPRIAFSIQRIWIQFVGLFFGYAGYLALTYLSYVLNNYKLEDVWNRFGLLPCLFITGEAFPWYSWLIWILGCLLLLFVYLVTNTAVARALYMISKGNHFYSWKEAFRFAFKKIWSILLTPVSIAFLIGLMILGSLVIGLLGKIPFIGELGISLFTIIWFIAALIMLFFAIVTLVALLLTPGIIATTDEDAFEAVFQVFSITWSQPCRFLFYQIINIVQAALSFAVFAFFVKKALVIMNTLFVHFMGRDFINLCNNGQTMVQKWTFLFQSVIDSIFKGCSPHIFFTHNYSLIPHSELPVTVIISSYLYAFSVLFIGALVISYALTTLTAGNTLQYLVMRKFKDQENLLERKDAEEEEEESEEKPAEQEPGPAAEKE